MSNQETLYDLLGARPNDDAENLKVAFRKAAKGAHPDINPGDPDAALKFRQIVRANEILSDEEQRAAYDHLLNLARLEQEAASKRATAEAIRRLATGVMVLAGVSVVSVGGYLLFGHVTGEPLPPAQTIEVFRHEAAQDTAVTTELPDTLGRVDSRDQLENVGAPKKLGLEDPKEATAPSAVAPAEQTSSAPASTNVSPVRDFGNDYVKHYRERGILAYRRGNLYLALAAFNLAIQLDPNCSDTYIDRGIVLYRMGDRERAFADVAEAERIDESNRNNSLSTTSAP